MYLCLKCYISHLFWIVHLYCMFQIYFFSDADGLSDSMMTLALQQENPQTTEDSKATTQTTLLRLDWSCSRSQGCDSLWTPTLAGRTNFGFSCHLCVSASQSVTEGMCVCATLYKGNHEP